MAAGCRNSHPERYSAVRFRAARSANIRNELRLLLVYVCYQSKSSPPRRFVEESPRPVPGLEPDRQPLGTVDVECLAGLPWRFARQRDVVQTIEQVGKGDPGLEPRQGRSQTEVRTLAESDMWVR